MEEKDCSFRYLLPEKAPGYISICAVSSDGKQIAGFETTRNEIYLWKRKHQHTINCFHTLSSIVTLTFSMNERCLFTLNSRNEIAFWDLGQVGVFIHFSIALFLFFVFIFFFSSHQLHLSSN